MISFHVTEMGAVHPFWFRGTKPFSYHEDDYVVFAPAEIWTSRYCLIFFEGGALLGVIGVLLIFPFSWGFSRRLSNG